MPKKSAGLLLYRYNKKTLQVLLVHPGGPFWIKKDAGVWSIPKGEMEQDEQPLAAAIREVEEETGIKTTGKYIELTPIKQKSGKMVYAWAIENDVEISSVISNTFEVEWPPASGKKKSFPEIDKAGWFVVSEAKIKILEAQFSFILELEKILRKI